MFNVKNHPKWWETFARSIRGRYIRTLKALMLLSVVHMRVVLGL